MLHGFCESQKIIHRFLPHKNVVYRKVINVYSCVFLSVCLLGSGYHVAINYVTIGQLQVTLYHYPNTPPPYIYWQSGG